MALGYPLRRLRSALIAIASVASLSGLGGCGGGSDAAPPPPAPAAPPTLHANSYANYKQMGLVPQALPPGDNTVRA